MRGRVWSQRRRFSPHSWTILLLLAAAAIALTSGWFDRSPAEVNGRAQAIDGDTLRIGDQHVRLLHLDAPEIDQTCLDADGAEWSCGVAAKSFLTDLLKRHAASCLRAGRDIYGRVLATCSLDGRDIGAQIVDAGWAVAEFGYLTEEERARAARLGIWSGSFVVPTDWRRTRNGYVGAGIWEWIRSWFQ